MTDVKVEIHGLRELAGAFKKVDSTLPKQMRIQFLGVAKQVVADARQDVPSRSGTAAGSIVPRAGQAGAGIAEGGSRAEYAPWLDFGGKVGRKHSVSRPFIRTGRFIYPAIEQNRREILEAADLAVKLVSEQAGFNTKGGL